MALFDNNRRNGIQMGTVGDECIECKRKHREDEDYIPESLDYKDVYKFWINNLSHCICLNCFKESLGKYWIQEIKKMYEYNDHTDKTDRINFDNHSLMNL